MPDHPSKTKWEKENVIVARVKVNKNQDPDIFQYLSKATNQAQATRQLLRAGFTALHQEESK